MRRSAATPGVMRPGSESDAKRAAKVADRIMEDVTSMGWQVGEVLGSEADLLERYHVSRAVFREAVRLVEHQQVARTRRGPGGGLVITEPTVGAVSDAVVLYLHRVDATLDEIFEARMILEELACQLAAERTEEAELASLGRFAGEGSMEPADDPRRLHMLVAEMSRNAGVQLFVDVLNRVVPLYAPDWQRFGRARGGEPERAQATLAEAITAGDAGLARTRMRRYLEAEAEFLRRRRSTHQLLPDSAVLAESPRGKGAEGVARHITRTVVAENLQPGDLVGTEPALIEREGVSRALLREAVRLLEYHHVARMRRGPGGGLFVVAPSANAVTETAAIYLTRQGMTQAELAELRAGVEVATTDLAAQRIDDQGSAGMRAALIREDGATDVELVETVHDLHAAVALAADNRVLGLVALVAIRLNRLQQMDRSAPKTRHQIKAEALRSHEGIATAIDAGDRALAAQRMRSHLEALGALTP